MTVTRLRDAAGPERPRRGQTSQGVDPDARPDVEAMRSIVE